jgi:L-2-hydroxycarboxylate dehydrogenase (NAD+)
MRIDAFQPANEFKIRMDEWIETFRSAKPAKGEVNIIIPGDPEREAEEKNMRDGIKLIPAIMDDLSEIAKKLQIEFGHKP